MTKNLFTILSLRRWRVVSIILEETQGQNQLRFPTSEYGTEVHINDDSEESTNFRHFFILPNDRSSPDKSKQEINCLQIYKQWV